MENGIYINKADKEYYSCDICEGTENVLKITGEAYCHEYGSCSSSKWICLKCLTDISIGKFQIQAGRKAETNSKCHNYVDTDYPAV